MTTAAWQRLREANRRTELAIRALRRLPYRDYLNTEHWQRVRTLALERARHACALCPAIAHLEVHHRSYARKGFEQPEDVIVLCEECHARHHGKLALAAVRAMDPEPLRVPLQADAIQWRIGA